MRLAPLLLLAACGVSSTVPRPREPSPGRAGDEQPDGEDGSTLAARWTGRAEAAWSSGDFARASSGFDRAVQADGSLVRARVGKARSLLAEGDATAAAELLAGVDDPGAKALRALALYQGSLPGAAGALEELAPTKGYPRDALALTRALRSRRPYQVEGARAAIPLLTDLPLPAVPAVADGTMVRMLVDTGASETVVDRTIAARLHFEGRHGVIGTLELGSIVVRNVPAVSRDLSQLGRSLGAPVTGVLGMRLLGLLHATIDYPSAWLALGAQGPDVRPAGTGVRVPYWLVDGQFLAVRARANEAPEGAFLVSGGGTFAVALSDEGLRAIGRREEELTREPDGFARYPLSKLRVGGLEVTDVPAIHFVFPERLVSETGVHFAGVLSHAFLAQWRLSIDSDHRALVFEQGGEE
ncbi:MAG: hypothetical protein HYY06_12225 [Deltaproteobacteria bacterium]|nr:hypothetical protein [Deltaproteobacteria bacterium]